jgi:hypothetical protein
LRSSAGVSASSALAAHQPGLFEHRVVVAREHAGQPAPARRRVTQPEAGGDLAGQAAALQVVDRLGRRLQLRAVVLRCALQHVGQRQPALGQALALLAVLGADLLLRHLHAHGLRQVGDGVDEAHAGVFGQEADGVAAGPAAEAVVELLGRADREAGRLLGVKGAQPHQVGAAALELHVAADHVDDVDTGQQVLQEAGGDHRWSLAARPRRPQVLSDRGCRRAPCRLPAGAVASANMPL